MGARPERRRRTDHASWNEQCSSAHAVGHIAYRRARRDGDGWHQGQYCFLVIMAVFRCPSCRTRRKSYALFSQHLRSSGHAVCKCGGYHHNHRPGSPYCYQNPLADLHHEARRCDDDATLERIALHIIETNPHMEAKVLELCETLKINLEGHHGAATEVI